VAWGLKIEARIDEQQRNLTRITGHIDRGILPITEERIKQLEAADVRKEALIDRLIETCRPHGTK